MNGNKFDPSNTNGTSNGSTTDFTLSEKFLNVNFIFKIISSA
jgi:hypothetical protein